MNNGTANVSAISFSSVITRLRLLSDVLTLIVGLLLFIIWFGSSMHAYVGRLAPQNESPQVPDAVELVVSIR